MRLVATPIVLLALLALPSIVSCAPEGEVADIVLRGGKIVTLDESLGEVEAVAARDGVIVAAGTAAEIEAWVGAGTNVIELDGRTAVPGFVEGHGHFTGIGQTLMNVDLRDAGSWDEVVARVAEAVAGREPGEWILGRGWHQSKWDTPPEPAVQGNPVHDALSALTPDNPVILTHASGHARMVNARVLELAGIDASTQDPAGGEILRKPDGSPTGVLRETAYGLVHGVYSLAMEERDPAEQQRLARREVELANEECLSKGVTALHDAGSPFAEVDLFRAMYDDGSLDVRLYVMLNESNEELAEKMVAYRTEGAAGGRMTVRAIKRVADGALGTHGAWLLERYEDVDTVGLPTTPVESLAETARLAREHDYQLAIHAIGDRQPVHCTSDAPWVPDRIGDKRSEEGAYVWRDLMESGAVIVSGTDAPVEDVDPIANFVSAVTRLTRHGNVFYGDQAMTRMEALAAATTNAAYAAFAEDVKGTLAPGMYADIVVLSQDILTVPDEQLADTRVEHTIVGGKVVYSAR